MDNYSNDCKEIVLILCKEFEKRNFTDNKILSFYFNVLVGLIEELELGQTEVETIMEILISKRKHKSESKENQ